MISLYNIWAVARIEMKTLLRSWFFRIFSIIAIVLLGFVNFGLLSGISNAPWGFRGNPSTVPYVNILFLNTVQAIIAIFLASDFLKRDKKLDTTEVVYMRSLTNADYVTGKTAGILLVFGILNVAVLLMSLIFNVFVAQSEVVFRAYLYYPLLISLPTLVFILGLAFFFMVTIRNQAVTFIILLGYIGATVFYFSRKFYFLFDYIAFNVPLMYSDFIGFADPLSLLTHRGIYLLLGLAFICFTIVLLKRLPQSKSMTLTARVLAFLFLAAGVALGFLYVRSATGGSDLRKRIISLSDELAGEPSVTPLRCDIKLEHERSLLRVQAAWRVRNDTPRALERYIFRLNPGLQVTGVVRADGRMEYSRDLHLLYREPERPLSPGAVDSFTLAYRGSPEKQACYADILESVRRQAYRVDNAEMFNVQKEYFFIGPDYLLLTPESGWFPQAGAGFNSRHPEIRRQDFIDFSLEVKTSPGLTVISQGRMDNPREGHFRFASEFPLPSLSLVIGRYERLSTSVDSVEYNIFIREGHDFFSPHFDEIGDTLGALIRDSRQDFENKLGLSYLYPRLSLVEVPINFHSYRHLWSVSQETVQPEMVLLPEKGLPLRGVDFKRMARRMQRRNQRTNEEISPRENQCNMFNIFLSSTLTEDFGSASPWSENPFATSTSYNIFPNFLSFAHYLESDQWPVLNMAFESFYAERLQNPSPDFMRFTVGLTPEERVNLALEEKILPQILADPEQRDLAHFVLKTKGYFLFQLLENRLGSDRFNAFLAALVETHRFRITSGEEFVEKLRQEFDFDFSPYIENWYQSKDLPGFLTGNFEAFKVLDGDRERYQVKFRLSNPESCEGMVKITIGRQGRRGGGRFRRMFAEAEEENFEKLVYLGAGENKELGFVLDFQPGSVSINTLVSKNIPSVISTNFSEFELNKKALPFDGERIREDPVRLLEPGDIVVDNEDAGFEFKKASSRSLLKRLLPKFSPSRDQKYVGLTFWSSTGTWLPTTNSKFYGKYARSAHYTSKGKGDRKAAWNAEIRESGYYDVYCYVSKIRSPWGRRNQESDFGHNSFIIYHDDGTEETDLDLNTAEDGWNYLGSFYISEGTARIEITNQTQARFVIADAIKWVKR
ncbi:MAG: hypothetical protein JXB45_00550 [Candidatus Krumholzibacteriota bacterium]|nr:hypothetical protein [Candidatus Krumholzibacteriota bacterium]